MPAFHLLDHALPTDRLGEWIFAGDILVFTQVPPLLQLVDAAHRLICDTLRDDDPPTAEQRLPAADFLPRVRCLQKTLFGENAPLTALMEQVLEWTGLDREDTYRDRFLARTVPSHASHRDERTQALPPHRDNWGSNLPQQINWWTPIYPIAATRTIALYPQYWSRPIANQSAEWDYEELKRFIAEGRGNDYLTLPAATEPLSPEQALAMVIRPGDLLCFSGAHLHQSLSDQSGITRFSIETRTFSMVHLRSGIGAPNIDGRAPRTVKEWFKRMSDGTSLDHAVQ